MPRKLTQEEFEQRVYECVGDKYSVVSEYNGKSKPIDLKCNIHNIIFQVSAECFMRGPKEIRCSCPKCSEEKKNEKIFYKQNRIRMCLLRKKIYSSKF